MYLMVVPHLLFIHFFFVIFWREKTKFKSKRESEKEEEKKNQKQPLKDSKEK